MQKASSHANTKTIKLMFRNNWLTGLNNSDAIRPNTDTIHTISNAILIALRIFTVFIDHFLITGHPAPQNPQPVDGVGARA